MIPTNQYTVRWNFENIDRDFDIFVVKKDREMYDSNVLDLQNSEVRALAVQYTFGNKCLVLFRKNEMTAARLSLAISAEYEDVTVSKVDIMDERTRNSTFYYQCRLLAMLLMNSLRTAYLEEEAYNNLSGKLLFTARNWTSRDKDTGKPYVIRTLEMVFEPGMCLKANVKTFRALQKKEEDKEAGASRKEIPGNGFEQKKRGTLYVFDKKTKTLRRRLKTDKGCERDEIFIEKGFKGKRSTVPFIKFSSLSAFKKSKAGVIYGFLTDVRHELSEYFTLEQLYREEDRVFTGAEMLCGGDRNIDWGAILNECGVNITDECITESSDNAMEALIEELAKQGVSATKGPLRENAYNIRLINDEEYYINEGLPDPYDADFGDMTVQHVTLPVLNSMERKKNGEACPLIRKLCMELVIKGDVDAGRVRVFDWKRFSHGDTWTFVWRKKKPGEDTARVRNYVYCFLRIDPEGRMEFSKYNDDDLLDSEEVLSVIACYSKKEADLRLHHKKYVEGIVYKDPANLHIIAKTCIYSMPDFEKIYHALYETGRKTPLDIPVVINALEKFCTEYPQYSHQAENVLREVRETDAQMIPLTRRSLREMLGMRSKAGKAMNRFLHENYGIWVSPEFKDRKFDEMFMLTRMTDIRYFYENDTSGETGLSTFNYYAGTRNEDLNQSLHTPCIFREVRAEKDLEFEALLPLMAVDFIRIAGYTVLPFPFKYLREYARKNVK